MSIADEYHPALIRRRCKSTRPVHSVIKGHRNIVKRQRARRVYLAIDIDLLGAKRSNTHRDLRLDENLCQRHGQTSLDLLRLQTFDMNWPDIRKIQIAILVNHESGHRIGRPSSCLAEGTLRLH